MLHGIHVGARAADGNVFPDLTRLLAGITTKYRIYGLAQQRFEACWFYEEFSGALVFVVFRVSELITVTLPFSFASIFGLYYSLVYLPLSTATVLTFLVPFCTAISGALFLKETFHLKEGLAGGKLKHGTYIR